MGTSRICPACHRPLADSAPDGVCPACLLKAGLGTDVDISPETQVDSNWKPPPAMAPEVVAGHFPQLEILEVLGQGGMATVYIARQPHLNRLVALKILAADKEKDPAFAERFTREAQTLARLNHPNIVTLYDFGRVDGMFYLLMEYIDGVSLRQLLQSKKLTPEEALAIVPRICEALQYAHEHGVVHRDIKPENVLLNQEGRVKIADFGIAKMLGTKPGQQTITRAEQVIGTPHYMAPEQVEKPQRVDHRADIYSLGVVFYEMLTSELPLGKFAPPSQRVQVDVRLDEVVLHALEKDPERRYQQVSQVKTDVEIIAAQPAPVPASSSAATTPWDFQFHTLGWLDAARWSARLLGAALLLFLALILGLLLFGTGLPPLALESGGTLLNYLALALLSLGFIVGWKYEGTAAVLISTGWALWHSANGSLAWSMFHVALLVAVLYALCWWATQGRRTWVLVGAVGALVALLVGGLMFLPTNVCLYGEVLDAATRRPIPNAELIVFRPPLPDGVPYPADAVRTTPEGRYVLSVGWYTPQNQVRVSAHGYASLQAALEPRSSPSRRSPRDFALAPLPVAPQAGLPAVSSNLPPQEVLAKAAASEVTRLKLKHAEQELVRVSELFANHSVDQSALDESQDKVALLKAELSGDEQAVIRIKLQRAEREFARISRLHQENLVSEAEYDGAAQAVELLKAELSQAELQQSPEYLLLKSWWGPESSQKIAARFSPEWLPRLSDDDALLRLGFALYDARRYSDASSVFRRLEEAGDRGRALVWQGHMLDLLGRRPEAIAAYQKALNAPLGGRHDQYGIVLNKDYVEERLKTPFTRVENNDMPPLSR